MEQLTITIKTLFGFEEILKEEVEALGYSNIKKLNRAVQLQADWKAVYTFNYKCRLAIAVLVEVANFNVKDEDDLYKKAKKINWTSYFDVSKTFAVKGAVFSTLFNHTMYPFLVVKDAIVDVFRDEFGERPNVNLKAPQVMFDVYIKEKNVTISLNTSGTPLFQRGYRQETGDAPMNEVLAAGLLKLSGWDGKSTLIDPMCGSGTLVIEAALMAADIPAMVERQHYAFKNFKSFNEEVWNEIVENSNRKPIKLDFLILASDNDAAVIQKAKRNSRIAPIGNMVQFELNSFKDIAPPTEKGTLICNPPYGERMGEEIELLYESLGDFFKQKMTGYDCWIVTSNMDAVKHVGLKPDSKLKVYNGSLACTFRKYSIFDGTKKEKYQKPTTEPLEVEEPKKTQAPRKSPDKPYSREEVKPTKSKTKYTTVPSSYLKEVEKEEEVKPEEEHASKDIKPKEKPPIAKTKDKLEALRKYRKRED